MSEYTKWGFSRIYEDSPEVFSFNDNGVIKYLEDPHAPGQDAVAEVGALQEAVSVLILPPCSVETIQALSSELPCLNHLIIVDTNEERLDAWHKGVAKCKFKGMSSMVLTTNINADKDVLMKILEPFPIAAHLWKISHYIPRRFNRVDRDLATYIKGLMHFAAAKVELTVNYQGGEAWHHIVNQMATLQDENIKNHIIAPQVEKRTFVIAGAGPSLEENIDILKKYRDRVVILACERSIGTFKSHNIKPDYIVSVENIILMWRHYEEHLDFLKGIPLIAPYLVSHVVARNYPGDIVYMKVQGNDEWLGDFGGELESDVGNCVGHYCYHVAAAFNPEKIILIGNDLALKNGRSHTGSTHSDGQGQRGIVTKGFYGGKVETTSTFYHYIQRFESYFRAAPCPSINATEGGAFLPGAEHLSLENALSVLPVISPLPYLEIPQNQVQDFYTTKIEELSHLRQQLVDSKINIETINRDQPEPFFQFMSDSLQVILNHFLPPKLYLHYYDILQNYLPRRYDNYKAIVEQLIKESIEACDFLLALDEVGAFAGKGVATNCLLLPTKDMDVSWLKDKYPTMNYTEMPALSHLPEIWQTIVANKIGTVISFESQIVPDTCTIPNINWLDIKSTKNVGRLCRTPKYQVVGINDEVMDAWDWQNHHLLQRFKRMTLDEYFSQLAVFKKKISDM